MTKENSYSSELKREAMKQNVEVWGTFSTADELRKNAPYMVDAGIDWIVCHENLASGEKIENVYTTIGKIGMEKNLFLILSSEANENFAIYMGIPYIRTDKIAPHHLFPILEHKKRRDKNDAMKDEEDKKQFARDEEEFSRKSQKTRDKEFKKNNKERKKELRRANVPERGEGYEEHEERSKLLNVHTDFSPIIVCIASSKGGVGKTTTAIELASVIAKRAKSIDPKTVAKIAHPWDFKVCLADFNPSFDTMAEILKCTRGIPKSELPTVKNWFEMYDKKFTQGLPPEIRQKKNYCEETGQYFEAEDYLEQYPVTFSEDEIYSLCVRDEDTGLYCIPAINEALEATEINPSYIPYILKLLHGFFDVVVVDTGNNISNFTINTIDTVDRTLIVCEKSNGAAKTVEKFLSTLEEIEVNSNKCYMVLSNAHGEGDNALSRDYEYRFGMKKIADIPYDKDVIKSHEKHEFYAVNNPRTEYAKTIVKLAHWIFPLWISLPTIEEEKPKKRKKFLGIF